MSGERLTDEELVHWHEYGTDLLDHNTADAILGELIASRRQIAESEERNSNLFDLANEHLDTIDRVRGVLGDYLDPEDADIECREDVWRFIRDLRAALEGGK